MFTNKHVIIALIVAPILAIMSYVATDAAVSEPPSIALKNESYPLAARPNCRYESGQCTLKNGELSIDLVFRYSESGELMLEAYSSVPVEGIKVSLQTETPLQQENNSLVDMPRQLSAQSQDQQTWSITLDKNILHSDEVKLVALANDALFYGSTSAIFKEHVPIFEH